MTQAISCDNCDRLRAHPEHAFCGFCGYSFTEDVIPIGFDVMVWAEIASALSEYRDGIDPGTAGNSFVDVCTALKKINDTIGGDNTIDGVEPEVPT